jgi:hypothetical protein
MGARPTVIGGMPGESPDGLKGAAVLVIDLMRLAEGPLIRHGRGPTQEVERMTPVPVQQRQRLHRQRRPRVIST